MKFYVIALSILCLSFLSCKKDRTCNCIINNSGVKTIHNQTAGTSVNIPPLPPVVLVAAKDTTYSDGYSYTTSQKTSYSKVSKNTMHGNCATSFEETVSDNTVNTTPGTSTITVLNYGKKTYACKIE